MGRNADPMGAGPAVAPKAEASAQDPKPPAFWSVSAREEPLFAAGKKPADEGCNGQAKAHRSKSARPKGHGAREREGDTFSLRGT